MALPSPSFLLGILVLAYLFTFVIFAVLRIVTGVSIQRLGFSSLRRIAYTPKDGVKLEIRGLGFQVHRPTFAQPTWISLVVSELKVTLDLATLRAQQHAAANGDVDPKQFAHKKKKDSKIWVRLTEVKDNIKRFHRIIAYVRLFDFVAHKTTFVVNGIGTLQVGSFVVSVDTRRATVDRARIFKHNRQRDTKETPAEWTVDIRSILFTPEGKDSIEILDHGQLKVHGLLKPKVDGLRDVALAVKLGRLHIPYDDFLESSISARSTARKPDDFSQEPQQVERNDTSPEDSSDEKPQVLKSVTDARGFISSILRGIHEISFAASFVGLSKRIDFVRPAGEPVYINMGMKEFGLDLYRLDPMTPAHSMYFERRDVAHQVLISAISIAVGVDDGLDHPERLVYIPMTTATIRTTLPAKVLQYAAREESTDRNTNVLFANLVITSPSVDCDPHHLPLVIALLQGRPKKPSQPHKDRPRFIQDLLPRLTLRLSIHEPVVRVSLPTSTPPSPRAFDFDLLISAVSSVSLDIDASHELTESKKSQYYLTSALRMVAHRLYYQNALKERHNLLTLDSVELKTRASTYPDLSVSANGSVNTFTMFLVRPEIFKGIHQITRQLRSSVRADKLHKAKTVHDANFIRTFPEWLKDIHFEANDFNVEIAAKDEKLSSQPRGFALHLENMSLDYKLQKDKTVHKFSKRKGADQLPHDTDGDDVPKLIVPPPNHRKPANRTDGRRVAVHVSGFEGFVIEAYNVWEQEPFIQLPKSEVAFTTSNDGYGPVLHLNSLIQGVYLQYSLFRHYCLGVAVAQLRRTFSKPSDPQSGEEASHTETPPQEVDSNPHHQSPELLVADTKIKFVQIKATFPSDPRVMLQIMDLEASKHRFTTPHVRALLMRLLCDSPSVKGCWNRIAGIKNPRIDLRESRRKPIRGSSVTHTERSIDVVTEAIRIGIPHGLIVHSIFDNFINTLKTAQQLHHRFITDSNEYILAKHPEGPKHVPRITVRSHVFLFEIEDGAFEWKLGVIFRTGLVEQKQRLAREEAFRLKKRELERARSGRGRTARLDPSATARTQSESSDDRDATPRSRWRRRSHGRGRSGSRHRRDRIPKDMRYDKEGQCAFSNESKVTPDKAWEKLKVYNSQSWKKRIDRAMNTQQGAMTEMRSLLWGMDAFPENPNRERILQMPTRPALMSILMSDLNITIDKPTFPLEKLPDFMHDVGKGLPKDTLFSLLVPLHASFEMGEARVSLRDYPLPLLHIPPIKPGQAPRLPSWSLKSNFVIGEEFRGSESIRDLKITVVPPERMDPEKSTGGFAVDVRRTLSVVKTYSDMKIDINTSRDTRFTWGTSYQPAIQDMMQVIEGFTKPQIDPSPRVGFWDKLRLNFHSRVCVNWKGGGDVHLMLKGSKDPYVVTGHGAGFVMVWRNNVSLNVWQENDPTKFMTVDAGDYILAIPDFSAQARASRDMLMHQAQGSRSLNSNKEGQKFKKVIMKLSGNVRWQVGLVFERTTPEGRRSFDFIPHFDITLRNPVHVKSIKDQPEYDAFRGFRSNFIHMSIAISAPHNRDWTNTNTKPQSTNYNSVHLSPRFFTHFFNWWSMFSGIMSLPIHQGKIWPGVEKSGKKFGRHLGTIKYSLLLAPLFISHIYKHKEAEEYAQEDNKTAATGLKVRLDSFMLDCHQRREEFMSEVQGHGKLVKTTAMKMNQILLDLIGADIRAVSASIDVPDMETVLHATNSKLAEYEEAKKNIDLQDFEIPDNDFSWIDVDDFVEVDWTLPIDSDPQVKILPLAGAPRFTYRRQTDHNNTISGDPNRKSPFGYESTHHCIMKSHDDSRQVQIDIISERLEKLKQMKAQHDHHMDEFHLQFIRESSDREETEMKMRELQEHSAVMAHKQMFLQKMIDDLRMRIQNNDLRVVPMPEEIDGHRDPGDDNSEADDINYLEQHKSVDYFKTNSSNPNPTSNALGEQVSDFNNRFVVHNSKIKWNNSLRNIMLRYFHQVSQRRGFVYYTTRRAVKFILDIVEEQQNRGAPEVDSGSSATPETPLSPEDEGDVQDRIAQLLQDGKDFVEADDPDSADARRGSWAGHDAHQDVSQDFAAMNTYHMRLVGPQIQLQSEKNPKSSVLVTARGMRLKVIQVMDKERMSDDVSGLVQRRFSVDMDNMQFFVTNQGTFAADHLHMYSGSTYGTPDGSLWPPWVPIEVMFDFSVPSLGFKRVVQRTSASLRYDKYNKLRIKYNDSVTDGKSADPKKSQQDESRMDQLWVDFPQLRAICDSQEYFAMYTIVVDVLMWSEPLEKVRNERLEKIMLAADFSDLRGAPEMVIKLQERIRQLDEIKTHFHINEKYLDRRGWRDRIALEKDLAQCEDELFFIMKAITTSQTKKDDRTDTSQTTGLLKWFLSANEIVWHLTKEGDQALAEFQLGTARFERTDNSDGSNHNYVEIDKIRGLNLLPNALYPEMVGPYTEASKLPIDEESIRMLRVKWHMLEAIAGIPIVDHFEVNLFPLKIQLEYETGRKLFEYIFPGKNNHTDDAAASSPFMIRHKPPKEIEEDEEALRDQERRRQAAVQESMNQRQGSATGAGSLEARLQPTIILPDDDTRPASSLSSRAKALGLSIQEGRASRSRLFAHSTSKSRSPSASSRVTGGRLSVDRGRDISRTTTGDSSVPSKKSRFSLGHRSSSQESRQHPRRRSDDLSQMMNRASNYMTLAYAKIPSVVLCLSYKGRGSRNFEDVHNLVFRMPTLEYRNKTWSNLDLALALKKDVIRALIHHTGTIIGNKFSHRRPGQSQTSRLRELASSSVVLSSSTDLVSVPASSHSSTPSSIPWTDSTTSPRVSDVYDNEVDSSLREEQDRRTYDNSIFSPTSEYPPGGPSQNGQSQNGHPQNGHPLNGSSDTPERNRDRLHRHLSDLKEKALEKAGRSREVSFSVPPPVAPEESDSHSARDEEETPGRRGTIKRILKRAGGHSTNN